MNVNCQNTMWNLEDTTHGMYTHTESTPNSNKEKKMTSTYQ